MIGVAVRVRNLPELRANFVKAPASALRYLALATQAAVFEVEKQAVDTNFRFKTPRSARTGYLALSFAYGRYIAPSGLRAAVGPTAHYADYVYSGTRRGISPNPYMDRIAEAAAPAVGGHFEKAIDKLVAEIADV